MGYKHGLRNKFYVSTTLHQAGTSITWSEVDLAESVGMEDSRSEAEVVNRRGEFVLYGVGKRTVTYTLPCTYDPADAAQAILWNAYRNGTTIAIADMDGPIATNGTKGMFMDCVVVSAPKPQDLAAFDSVEFGIKPAAASTYTPNFMTIAGVTTTAAP
jgi:hypothetical protein